MGHPVYNIPNKLPIIIVIIATLRVLPPESTQNSRGHPLSHLLPAYPEKVSYITHTLLSLSTVLNRQSPCKLALRNRLSLMTLEEDLHDVHLAATLQRHPGHQHEGRLPPGGQIPPEHHPSGRVHGHADGGDNRSGHPEDNDAGGGPRRARNVGRGLVQQVRSQLTRRIALMVFFG